LKKRRFHLPLALTWIVLLFLIVPSLVAFPVSVTNQNYLSFPDGEISWKHFENLFSSPEWISSFVQSAIVAFCSSIVATIAGSLCAVGLWRLSSQLGEIVRAILLLPLIIPSIISAMAFYRLWIPLGLIDSYAGLILAHSILALPMVLITVSASLANFDFDSTGHFRGGGVFVHPFMGRDRRRTVYFKVFRIHSPPAAVERNEGKYRSDGRSCRCDTDHNHLGSHACL